MTRTRLIPLASVLLVLLAPAAGHADGRWTHLGPDGGNVCGLAVDPITPSTLYAGTVYKGIFKSVSGWQSWVPANTGLPLYTTNISALALDPTTPTTAYARTSNGIFVLRPGKVGAFRPSDGTFYLDYNGNGTWEGCVRDWCLQIGMNGDVPLVGDWNGNGTSKVGAFRPADGTFYLDYNGSGTWEGCGTDRCLQIGLSGDAPLVGKW